MKLAGWRYARWGMSADELVAASAGVARKLEAAEHDEKSGAGFTTLAVAELASGPFEFDVSFRAVDAGTGLTHVRLELRHPGQYEALRAALADEYGAGEPLPADGDPAIEGVRWRTAGTVLALKRLVWPMDLGVDVVVDCEPSDPMVEPAPRR